MSGNSKKPSEVYPLSPTSTPSPMPPQIPDPSIRSGSFDQLITNRGIRFIHRRFAPCPNFTTVETGNHDPLCTVCDGNGGVYYSDKEVFGVFVSNSLQKNFEQQGIWEIGTAVVSLPAYYDDGSVAEFQTYDQLMIPDFPVRMWQRVNYEPNSLGITKTRYPIDTIDIVFSVRNDVRFDFIEGTDYTIDGGDIKWLPGRQPQYNSTKELGESISIVYHANPIYTVLQHMRELRITQEFQDATGQKIATRMPQQILVKKQFLVRESE